MLNRHPTLTEILARIAADDAERAKAEPLRRCPFCGDTARLTRCAGAWAAWCDRLECGVTGPMRRTAEEAARAWNWREA